MAALPKSPATSRTTIPVWRRSSRPASSRISSTAAPDGLAIATGPSANRTSRGPERLRRRLVETQIVAGITGRNDAVCADPDDLQPPVAQKRCTLSQGVVAEGPPEDHRLLVPDGVQLFGAERADTVLVPEERADMRGHILAESLAEGQVRTRDRPAEGTIAPDHPGSSARAGSAAAGGQCSTARARRRWRQGWPAVRRGSGQAQWPQSAGAAAASPGASQGPRQPHPRPKADSRNGSRRRWRPGVSRQRAAGQSARPAVRRGRDRT